MNESTNPTHQGEHTTGRLVGGQPARFGSDGVVAPNGAGGMGTVCEVFRPRPRPAATGRPGDVAEGRRTGGTPAPPGALRLQGRVALDSRRWRPSRSCLQAFHSVDGRCVVAHLHGLL